MWRSPRAGVVWALQLLLLLRVLCASEGQTVSVLQKFGWYTNDNSTLGTVLAEQQASDLHCNPIQTYPTLPASGGQLQSFGVVYVPSYSSPFTSGPYAGQYPTVRLGVYQVMSASNWTLLASTNASSDIPLFYVPSGQSIDLTSSGPLYIPSGASTAVLYPNASYSMCFSINALDYPGGNAVMVYWPQDAGQTNYAYLQYDYTSNFPLNFPVSASAGTSSTTWQYWMNLQVALPANGTTPTPLGWYTMDNSVTDYIVEQVANDLHCNPLQTFPDLPASGAQLLSFGTAYYPPLSTVFTAGPYSGQYPVARLGVYQVDASNVWTLLASTNASSDIPLTYSTAASATIATSSGPLYIPSNASSVYLYGNYSYSFCFTNNALDWAGGNAYQPYWNEDIDSVNYAWLSYTYPDNFPLNYPAAAAYGQSIDTWQLWANVAVPNTALVNLTKTTGGLTRFSFCLITSDYAAPSFTGFTQPILTNSSGFITAYQFSSNQYYITALTGTMTIGAAGSYPLYLSDFEYGDQEFGVASGQVQTDFSGVSVTTNLTTLNLYEGYILSDGVIDAGSYYTWYITPYTPGSSVVLSCAVPTGLQSNTSAVLFTFSYCILTSNYASPSLTGTRTILTNSSGFLSGYQFAANSYQIISMNGSMTVGAAGSYPLSLVDFEYGDQRITVASGQVQTDWSGVSFTSNLTTLNLYEGYVVAAGEVDAGSYYTWYIAPFTPGSSAPLSCAVPTYLQSNYTIVVASFSYCILTSTNHNPTLSGPNLILTNASGILTALYSSNYAITSMTGAITSLGVGTFPITLLPADSYYNDNMFTLSSSGLAVLDFNGISFSFNLGRVNLYEGYVLSEADVTVGPYYNMFVQNYTAGGPVVPCTPPPTATVVAPACGGAGYSLSGVGVTDLTYTSNGTTYTFNPCRPVTSSPCSVSSASTASLCVNTSLTSHYAAAYYAPAYDPVLTSTIPNGIQQYYRNGDACGLIVRDVTVQFVCGYAATTAFISSANASGPCSTALVVQTAAVCGAPLALSTPGYSFSSTTCGGGLFDLTALDSSDFQFQDYAGTTYFWRPCSSVSVSNCSSALPTSWCQLGDIAYSLAAVSGHATSYTRLSNGLLMQIQDGSTCGTGFPRAANIELVCNATATAPWLASYVESAGGSSGQNSDGEGYCHYIAVIHTSSVCTLLSPQSSSSAPPSPVTSVTSAPSLSSSPSTLRSSSTPSSSAASPASSSASSAAVVVRASSSAPSPVSSSAAVPVVPSTAASPVSSSAASPRVPTSPPVPIPSSTVAAPVAALVTSSPSTALPSAVSSSTSTAGAVPAGGGGSSSSSGLSGGAIAGVVIGSVVGVCLLCVLLFVCAGFGRRHKGGEAGEVKPTRMSSDDEPEQSQIGESDTVEEVEMA